MSHNQNRKVRICTAMDSYMDTSARPDKPEKSLVLQNITIQTQQFKSQPNAL